MLMERFEMFFETIEMEEEIAIGHLNLWIHLKLMDTPQSNG